MRILDAWPALMMLALGLFLAILPVLLMFSGDFGGVFAGIVMAVFAWPVCLFLASLMIPVGPFARAFCFITSPPLPVGQYDPARVAGERTIIRQRFASGAIGTGLCGFQSGLHVTLTNMRLTIDSALTLPGICLLTLAHDEIDHVEAAVWRAFRANPAVAITFTRDGKQAALTFTTKNPEAWLDACAKAGLTVESSRAHCNGRST